MPDTAKNDQIREMELYLGTMMRQVDSSLLDEWEKMRDPNYEPRIAAERAGSAGVDLRPPGAEEAAADITRDTKAFTAAIRNRIFTFLRGLVIGDLEAALASLASRGGDELERQQGTERTSTISPGEAWTAERLAQALDAYHAEHERICLDPNARNLRHTYVTPSEDKKTWRVQQMLVDPEEHNDWVAEFEVDLAQSRKSGEPVMHLVRLGSLTH